MCIQSLLPVIIDNWERDWDIMVQDKKRQKGCENLSQPIKSWACW
jgi:hypothetical protein